MTRAARTEAGQLDVFEDTGRDTVRALPVRGIGEPASQRGECGHRA